eukprot:74277-Chlamydomonas_euryale.AAC.1
MVPVKRNYAFEVDGVPHGEQYVIKVGMSLFSTCPPAVRVTPQYGVPNGGQYVTNVHVACPPRSRWRPASRPQQVASSQLSAASSVQRCVPPDLCASCPLVAWHAGRSGSACSLLPPLTLFPLPAPSLVYGRHSMVHCRPSPALVVLLPRPFNAPFRPTMAVVRLSCGCSAAAVWLMCSCRAAAVRLPCGCRVGDVWLRCGCRVGAV